MVDTAAFLVDHVMPDAALVRQWVLSLPYRVRFVCAHDLAQEAVDAVPGVRSKGGGVRVVWTAASFTYTPNSLEVDD
ncbi:MAG: hypothetical protein ACJAYX_003013 [Planctomycetota bacterium]|jgi:hypothetical protein